MKLNLAGFAVADFDRIDELFKKKKKTPPPEDPNIADLEGRLAERLGFRVKVIDRNGKGEVRAFYKTLEQLDEICRRLGRSSQSL